MRRATKKNRVVRMRARATWAYPMLAVMLLLLPTMAPVCLTETEPNDTTGEANLIRPGEFGRGNITPIGDADFWRARILTPEIESFSRAEMRIIIEPCAVIE